MSWSAAGADLALVAVVAEGTISEARTEFEGIYPGDGSGLLSTKSVIGPALGLTAEKLRLMSNSGTALLWTPRSDFFLYGHRAPVTIFDAFGGEILLGRRWTFTGSGSVLRQLAAAREVNCRCLDSHFTDRELVAVARSADDEPVTRRSRSPSESTSTRLSAPFWTPVSKAPSAPLTCSSSPALT